MEYTVGEQEKFTLIFLMLGKTSTELTVRVALIGQSGQADILGVVVGKNDCRMVVHTLQEHMAPETTSNLLVKSVGFNRANFSYDGGITVAKAAQKTNAYQRNENLLLSKDASAQSQPTLEILANDVRCTHGATVGMLPADQLWYLSTRGISRKHAETLIVTGFLTGTLDKIQDEAIKKNVTQKICRVL